jgi:hypothetical protein
VRHLPVSAAARVKTQPAPQILVAMRVFGGVVARSSTGAENQPNEAARRGKYEALPRFLGSVPTRRR